MYDDIGKLILRLTLGILMLLHGIAKLRYGVSGIEGMVSSQGLPGFLAYGVFVGEVIAPLMVIAGWNTRIGGAIMALNMIIAITLAHSTQLFAIGKQGGWELELQGFFLFTAVTVALIGPGKFSLNRR